MVGSFTAHAAATLRCPKVVTSPATKRFALGTGRIFSATQWRNALHITDANPVTPDDDPHSSPRAQVASHAWTEEPASHSIPVKARLGPRPVVGSLLRAPSSCMRD